jgi:hypothetical protein
METKICLDCGEEKDITLFHWSDRQKGIKKSYCNKCSVERVREYVENDPVAHRIYMQKHYRENPHLYPGNHYSKSTPAECGIYKITCLITGDTYVGCSSNLRNRLYKHKRNTGRAVQKDLKKLINLYTWDAFSWEVLETCDTDAKFERETYWIQELKPTLNRWKNL